jgi:seryl-tRNA synthetase
MSEDKIKKLEADLKAAKEKATELEKSNKVLSAKVADQEKELADAQKMVSTLKEQVKDAKGYKVPTGKVGNDTYKIIGGFRTKEKVYKPEDIAADEKVLAALVKKGSGLVQLIPKKK